MAKVSAYGRHVVVEVQQTKPLKYMPTTTLRETRRYMSDSKVLVRCDFRSEGESKWRSGTWKVVNGNQALTLGPVEWLAEKRAQGWEVLQTEV